MMPDFPYNIRIRLARLKFLLLYPDVALSGRIKKNFFMGPILFLYYVESLVSSNLNSKLFRFPCVRPNVHIRIFLGSIGKMMPRFQQKSGTFVYVSIVVAW